MKKILKQISKILDYIYGIGILLALFVGGLTFIGFIVAFIVGGNVATTICTFIYKKIFSFLIYASSVIVLLGLVNMYIKNQKLLSVNDKEKSSEKQN